jgi:hypothetical protein
MFQPATFGLCVSLLADLFPVGATRVDLATGARAELNVGRIPVTSVDDSEPGTEETIVLRSGLRLISPTSTFSIAYKPRYYLRLPDALEVGRPLLLHEGSLAWNAALSRRFSLDWGLRSSAGELPNSGLALVFDPGTGRVRASVVPIFRVDTNLSMTARTGKRHTTGASVGGSHNDSLGPDSAFERSENIALTASHSVSLSRRTALGVSAQAGYAWPEFTDESATLGGQIFVDRQLLESARLRVAAGISQGWVWGGEVTWPLPTLDIGYSTTFRATGQAWNLSVNGGTRAFFDVASVLYRPQVFLALGISGQILNTWTVASSLTFSTDISRADQTNGGQPTQLNFDLPVTYRIDPNLRLSFGLRLALSAPPLSAWNTGAFQDQVSTFVALEWGVSTEKSQGGWL